jgi:hypothetical protein
MIGVAVNATEREIVTEFFELFKTSWEFCRPGEKYDVVLTTSGDGCSEGHRLTVIFQSEVTSFDVQQKAAAKPRSGGNVLSDEGNRLPIYGTLITFADRADTLLKEETTGEATAFVVQTGGRQTLRIGYNLFNEIRFLLNSGQPTENAGIPTLERHIAWLRDWITRAGLPSVEIPPIPDGYRFIGCLTHDIDHPGLRNHWCDHTMLGFLYRSTVGTSIDVFRRRKSLRNLWKNWGAACRLPLVHLGVANDFWAGFDNYLEIEKGCGATFFVIPRGGYAGRTLDGLAPSKRACRYKIDDLTPKLRKIISAGCEVGVHGLDAWLDTDAGRRERDTVARSVGTEELGIRMHWLFFDENSPAVLDRAGFSYDSTVGYRETIGYRAGTTQVYKPPGATRLLELPLHVMDTALFYPGYLGLSDQDAEHAVHKLLNDVQQIGGVLTVNWHDRSIAPERLWDNSYLSLLGALRIRGAWLPNAGSAVGWFRKRRSAKISWLWSGANTVRVRGCLRSDDSTPALKIRVYKPRAQSLATAANAMEQPEFIDRRFESTTEVSFAV